MAEETTTQTLTPEQSEAQARKQGWKPKEEFAGNPADWVDASEFLERGRTWAPITAAKNRELEKTLKEMQKLLKDQMALNHNRAVTVRKQHEDNIKTLQNRIQSLESQLQKAVTENDGAGIVQAHTAIRKAEASLHESEAQIQGVDQESQRIADQWKATHTWYGDEQEATEYADFIGQRAALAGKTPVEILDEIDTKVKKKYPELYVEGDDVEEVKPVTSKTTRRSVSTKQEDGASAGGMKWSDLSADEQQTATQVMKKFNISRDAYLKQLGDVF